MEGTKSTHSPNTANSTDPLLSPSRLVASPARTADVEKRSSMEKQKAYQDAFLEQMNQYIQHGEVESKKDPLFILKP